MGNTTDLTKADHSLKHDQSSLRNKLINGNFDFWQRNTTFSTPANLDYTADRWAVNYDGTIGAFTLSQQSLAAGDIYGATSFLRWAQTSAGGSSTLRSLIQRIEDVRTVASKACTVSFWAKADSARSVTVAATQNFGSGGSTAVRTALGTVALTTSWQYFTVTAILPSIAGKTIGADNFLQIQFELPINVTMTIDVSQIQAEEGDSASQFELRNYALGLILCQRYYESGAYSWGGVSTASSQAQMQQFMFKVTKRKAPTVATSSVVLSGVTNTSTTPTIGAVIQVVTSSLTGVISYSYNWAAEAEL